MYGFFRLKRLEHSYTFWGDIENAFYVGVATFIIYLAVLSSTNSPAKSYIAFIILSSCTLGLAYALIRRRQIKNYLKQRFLELSGWAQAKGGWIYSGLSEYTAATKDTNIGKTTLAHLSSPADFQNFLVTSNWTYFDFSYAKYRKTKYGEFKSADVYYGVIKTKLPRPLPNVFFDSKLARRRQFRYVFSKRQIYHFEGDFDNYFTAYIPTNYSLDSLSFITPDVMQALKAASMYDAEIISDEIYLYGPIYDYDKQVADMSSKVLAISKTLALTVSAYHDDHLPAEAGWHQVSTEGSKLARSRFWAYVNIAGVAIYLIVRMILAITTKK